MSVKQLSIIKLHFHKRRKEGGFQLEKVYPIIYHPNRKKINVIGRPQNSQHQKS